jgi:cell division protein FtsW
MATSYRVSSPRWKREADGLSRRPGGKSLPGRDLPVDKILLAIVLGLTLFGAVMVYSASAILAEKSYGSQFYFLARQSRWGLIGLIGMAIALRIDYRHYKRPLVVFGLLAATAVLLVAVLFFPEINGTHRWITYGGFVSIQPSEISKLALIVFLAFFLERRLAEVDDYKRAFIPAAGVAGAMIALVAAEPDLGTALTLGLIFLVMTFHAGMPLRHLATLAIPAVPALTYMLVFVPWRLQRLLDFIDPWKNQTTSSFQVVQSLIAIGSGGSSGVGFAQSKQKLFYLPAPHTDFIFAVIGEELGLIGASTLVLLFALLAWRGLEAARRAPDLFGQFVALGLTTMITAQALFNVSVTLSLVPTKGITLPFISYGGSSLAISLFAAGVLLNISKHEKA